jgi:hypothetical protein
MRTLSACHLQVLLLPGMRFALFICMLLCWKEHWEGSIGNDRLPLILPPPPFAVVPFCRLQETPLLPAPCCATTSKWTCSQ